MGSASTGRWLEGPEGLEAVAVSFRFHSSTGTREMSKSKIANELVLEAWRKLPAERQEAEFLKAQDEIGELRIELAACDPNAVRVEAGIWEVDAQRWKVRATAAETEFGRLNTANADLQFRLERVLDASCNGLRNLDAEVQRLRAENADLQLARARLLKSADLLQAHNQRLDALREWFEERELLVQAAFFASPGREAERYQRLVAWEAANPKP